MIPTIVSVMAVFWVELDFFADPDEKDHQGEEADAYQDVE